jgi:DNA-binding NarL/FixJ family response regulator
MNSLEFNGLYKLFFPTKPFKEIVMNANTTKQNLAAMTSEELIEHYTNKSIAIRELFKRGFERKEIAVLLNIRYQHVRNVLVTPVKKER